MKGNRKTYLIVLACTVVFLVLVSIINQPEQRWVATWSSLDKEPFGGYVTHDLMQEMFPGRQVRSEYRTLYEVLKKDSLNPPTGSLLVVANSLKFEQQDWEALMGHLKKGHSALLATQHLSGFPVDSLGLSIQTAEGFSPADLKNDLSGEATTALHFTANGYPDKDFEINREATTYHFKVDSTGFVSLAKNENGKAVLLEYKVGEGRFFLSSTPLLLTNYYLLDDSSAGFAAGLLSTLPSDEDVIHVEYYSVGRLQAQTPMRYVLSHPALKTAFWLTLTGLLLFMVFEARRRQRIIPVVEPPANTSLEFVNTLGQLYYTSKGNHLNLAKKRLNYFLEYVRRHYYLATNELAEDFVKELALKSGKEKKRIEKMVQLFNRIKTGEITQTEFLTMEKWLQDFYGTEPKDKDKNQ